MFHPRVRDNQPAVWVYPDDWLSLWPRGLTMSDEDKASMLYIRRLKPRRSDGRIGIDHHWFHNTLERYRGPISSQAIANLKATRKLS